MTLDDLLKIAARKPRIVPVAIGDDTAYVRGLKAGEVERLSSLAAEDEGQNIRALLVAQALCDADGNGLCGDVEASAERLVDLPEWTLKRLYDAVDRASDVEAGGCEALAKNSPAKTAD